MSKFYITLLRSWKDFSPKC